MKFKKNGGFTLVELIVVIAILAILAGIAVPAYSGYIQKANAAADQTMLGTVNTAFGAACLENGVDAASVTGAYMPVAADGTIDLAKLAETDASGNAKYFYGEAFARYYAGNEGSAFKTIKSLVYDTNKHVFVDPATSASVTVSYAGTQVVVTGSAAAAMQNSSFGNMGGAGLADSVSDLTGLVAGDSSTTMYDMATNLYGTDGMETATQLLEKYTGMTRDQIYVQADGETDDEYNARLKNMLANSIVLDVANTSTTMDKATLSTYVNGGNASSGTEGLAQAALAYGMYTAYVNSGSAPAGTTLDIDSMKAALGNKDSDFNKYLATDQAQTDMDAYISTLGVIGNNSSNVELTNNIVTNGFSSTDNAELTALLQQLLGS